MSDDNKNESKTKPEEHIKDLWMIRPCEVYEEEYSDCTAIKARLHQYFLYGETLDCSQWKRDYNNCFKWGDKNDVKAAKELIESEKKRRLERLAPHYNNSVWKLRKEPPENWNAPLPDFLQKEYENSYLNIKAKEMRGEIPEMIDPANYCTIL